MGSAALGFLAGVLSTLSPCVLPLIPIVLAAAASEHRAGPMALAAGVAISFTALGLFVATIGFSLGLDAGVFRSVGGVLLILIGLVLVTPVLQTQFATAAGPAGAWIDNRFGGFSSGGLGGQFALGLLLGAVWSPCVGPTLGAASLLAARGEDLGEVALVMAAFGIGAALPLLLLGMLSREALMRMRDRLLAGGRRGKMTLGALLLVLGISIVSGLDKRLEAVLVDNSPAWLKPHHQHLRGRMNLNTFLAALMFAGGAIVTSNGPAGAQSAYGQFIAAYDPMLKSHLSPAKKAGIPYTAVDYDAWRADPRHDQALAALLKTQPARLTSKAAKLAYWINAYNFLTIDLIVRENETDSIKNLGSLLQSAWKKHRWPIGGRELSLDDIEHGIIRPLGEARIHFAVNCAAISCPDLRREAYRADRLDAQLEDQTKATLANAAKGLRRDAGGSARVTRLMDWYGEDFAGGDVRAWLAPRVTPPIPQEAAIRFLDYNWALNGR
jgi:cytochrome c-type biogenesis protein